MSEAKLRRRPVGDPAALPDTLPPILRRLYASRGLSSSSEFTHDLKSLLPPRDLRGIVRACEILHGALQAQKTIVVVGDYDSDGATGTALAVLALKAFGAQRVSYLVPSRFTQGYGLSPELARIAAEQGAQLLITVDNGIASVSGVAAAKALGLQVLITDHHLPGQELPAADAIVNPNQPGCDFASKSIAGVGVMFYVLSALRAHLRDAGWFQNRAEPNLAEFLDLVAVGTVADVVRLDANNRILVAQGLNRIRAARARPGILALLRVANRKPEHVSASDLGFAIGPRLNAAGRLEDMALGIDCLLSDNETDASRIAQQLDQLNRSRREIETQMRDEALAMIETLEAQQTGVSLFDANWHEGIVGLVASKIKDKLHRPTVAFAQAQEAGMLKGSARSIPGLHIRDALAAVDAQQPGLIVRFGGHAMAAGLSLPEKNLAAFSQAFDAACRTALSPADLERVIVTDGALATTELTLETALALETAGPWGQGFPEPLFEGSFEVASHRVVAEKHRKFELRQNGATIGALWFGSVERPLPTASDVWVFRLAVDRYREPYKPMLMVETVIQNTEAHSSI